MRTSNIIIIAGIGSKKSWSKKLKTSLNTQTLGKSGPTIVMLHGWGQSLESMRLLGDLLSRFYTVHVIDLPGFGHSEAPEADWDTTQYAERISQYIDDENLGSVIVIGHSFGGRVGIRLASRYPDKVRRLILINSGGLRARLEGARKNRAERIKLIRSTVKTIDGLFGTKLFQQWFVPRYASTDYKNAGALRGILVKAVNEDVSEDAAAIKCPTFLLWGERDTETPVDIAYRLKQLIPGAMLTVLPGKDHFPFVDEGAHLCAHHVLAFLSQAERSSEHAGALSRV